MRTTRALGPLCPSAARHLSLKEISPTGWGKATRGQVADLSTERGGGAPPPTAVNVGTADTMPKATATTQWTQLELELETDQAKTGLINKKDFQITASSSNELLPRKSNLEARITSRQADITATTNNQAKQPSLRWLA